ncbi:conjugal transfer protein TraH [Ensifer sp. ENS06]|uniref:TraH family protein n=1 Tax=Ensifer sp. ENS06 TaxID=2769276 RepID=UPI00177D6DE7|nr:TraH family protein [Ensifer sp. ENS06]MBD9627959.1 conjugal transfer protein TraH [Ensifer sp. ENS06]
MLHAALIKECADPSLKPAIVEQFIAAAGSPDPLSITVKSGGRLILVSKARSTKEAIEIIRQHADKAVVRVGLTQIPAGVGVKQLTDLKTDLIDACQNLRKGTAMFSKVLRIVAKWYGNPISADVFPQIFDDAVYAWKTGEFEGVGVFQAEDPGNGMDMENAARPTDDAGNGDSSPESETTESPEQTQPIGSAEMRIDLSRIGGK